VSPYPFVPFVSFGVHGMHGRGEDMLCGVVYGRAGVVQQLLHGVVEVRVCLGLHGGTCKRGGPLAFVSV